MRDKDDFGYDREDDSFKRDRNNHRKFNSSYRNNRNYSVRQENSIWKIIGIIFLSIFVLWFIFYMFFITLGLATFGASTRSMWGSKYDVDSAISDSEKINEHTRENVKEIYKMLDELEPPQ